MDVEGCTALSALSQSDPREVGKALLPWLRARNGEASDLAIADVSRPAIGGSSDTYFLNVDIGDRRERWVVRIEATEYQVYQHPTLEWQYRVMKELGKAGQVPAPPVLWYEADTDIVGAPFFLMERVEGSVPTQMYHSDGLLKEATPAAREAMWLSAVEALAQIHKTDVEPFRFLDRPELGATGLDQEIAAWDDYARWTGVPLQPVQERTRLWLADHAPAHGMTGLAWGDARPGNMIFRDNRCRAVLDWETVSLGGAESDLGWWLFYDWFVTDGIGAPWLDGYGTRDQFVRAWEEFAGRKAQDLHWHEVFATWRFILIRDRAIDLARKVYGHNPYELPDPDPMLVRLEMLTG